VVGASPGRISLPQLHSHIGGVLRGDISELMALCVCRFLELAALSFLNGVVEAETTIPSGVSIVLLCPRYYSVGSNVMVEQGGCVCVCDIWKMVYSVLGLWMEADSSDFLTRRHSRAGVSRVRSRVRGHVALV
jgi:hypothetical protein